MITIFVDFGAMGTLEWRNWDYAKECTKKYGKNDEQTMQILDEPIDVGQFKMFVGPVFENALKNCNDNRTFTDEEISMACDCYNNSVYVAGAYDNLSPNDKQLREKCSEIFANYDDNSKKELCEANK